MSRLIHTGIIGFGLSGKVFHAPFIHSHPSFHLATVVERNHQISKEIYPYVSVVNNYIDLLKDDSIELIIVATPNTSHYPMAKECLMAGKHVVIEKPFTPSSDEADELIRLSENTGKHVFVFQNRRWDGDFLTIRKLVEENRLGDIDYYEAHFDRFSPELKPNAWRDINIPGGGILYDLGAHLIDQSLVLFGMPEALRADIKSERPGSTVDDYFKLELLYPDKEVVLKAGMMVKKLGPRYVIEGSEATFTKFGIDPQEASLKNGEMPGTENWGEDKAEFFGKIDYYKEEAQMTKTINTEKGNYMAFYDNVCEVLTKNMPLLVSPKDARDVIFIIEKAFESHRKKQLIKINSTPS
ncbi:MAG: oxidoreductase [Bacteroidota bacterium]